jgi:MFS transporter, DHA1 family, multidrug resistance protein
MTRQKYISLILILGMLTALGPFSIDMYLPGFPAIAKDLNTSVAQVALSLSSFFIGISVGQLFYGPMLDRFGRKKPLYIGLSLYIVACIGCLFVDTIDELIILRFIQAIGSCAAGVASVTLVRDLFPVEDNAKVFALLMLVLGVSPMVAPTVGGYVTTEFGWQTVFLILAVMATLMLTASALWIPNIYRLDKSYSLNPVQLVKNYIAVSKNTQFFTYAMTGAFAFAGLFAYISSSPLVFMDIYKVNGELYGWIFAFLSVGFIASSQVNTLMLQNFNSQQIVKTALLCQFAIGISFLVLTISGMIGLIGTTACLFLYLCCMGFINPNTSALSLAPFTKNAGTASALMGSLQMTIGAVFSIAVGMFNSHNAIPMVSLMALAVSLSLITLFVGSNRITRMRSAEAVEMGSLV